MISPMDTKTEAIKTIILAVCGAAMFAVKAAFYLLAIAAFCKYLFN